MSEEQIIQDFSREMLKKIEFRHNRYVPLGWTTLDKKRVLELLKGEIKEFEEGNVNEQYDEAIDIANYAMFLWYLSK